MKWVIIGLFGLGLAAAICAAILVVSFQEDGSGDGQHASSDVAVLVASNDLDALTVLDQGGVTVRRVPIATAPPGALSDPVQAVGKVLLSSVHEGQALTAASFIADGSSARLAASLEPGFRAVNVALTDPMGLEKLLAPGCVVDVLASIEMQTADGATNEPVSITLLQGVRVLAVGDLTVVSAGASEADASAAGNTRSRPTVTLLVDARQAEKLKLAMQEGSVTLALRNPKDVAHVDVPGTGLASLAPIFAFAHEPTDDDEADPAPVVLMAPVVPQSLQRQWETVVLRGGVAETRTFSQRDAAHDR